MSLNSSSSCCCKSEEEETDGDGFQLVQQRAELNEKPVYDHHHLHQHHHPHRTCWSHFGLFLLLTLYSFSHLNCLEVTTSTTFSTITTILPRSTLLTTSMPKVHFTTQPKTITLAPMLNDDNDNQQGRGSNANWSSLSSSSSSPVFSLRQRSEEKGEEENANSNSTIVNSTVEDSTQLILFHIDPEYVLFRDTVRFWVQRVFVPFIMVVGIVGNTITMVIMTRRRMRSSTNWYLAALAIFDMLYLIFTFILSLKHYPNAYDVTYYAYWYMIPFSHMITDAASNTSVWLTVTFTIERYIAVCHPIKGKVICTESRAKKVIFCVFIICVSITLPTPFEWVVYEHYDMATNSTRMKVAFSELGQNATYKSIYYHTTVFLFVLLPLVLLVIFNSFLIRSVHQSTKQRSKMVMGKDNSHQSGKGDHSTASNSSSSGASPSSSRQEIRITVMLIAVVILFLICQTPTACILVYTVFHEPDPTTNEGALITGLSNIFNFLMSINAAGNFVLYCLLSQKYRRTFVNMFCPCIAPKYLRAQSTYPRTTEVTVANHHHHQHHQQSFHQNHHHLSTHLNNNNHHQQRFGDDGPGDDGSASSSSIKQRNNSNGLLANQQMSSSAAPNCLRSSSSSSVSTNQESSGGGLHPHHPNQRGNLATGVSSCSILKRSPQSSVRFRTTTSDHPQRGSVDSGGTTTAAAQVTNGGTKNEMSLSNGPESPPLISPQSISDD